ncbi:hypothetical protein ID866_11482 [Astraeus odoratus]|nr:hypothetical protein ID866_11482 [Astraeus odoratus]
MSSSKNIMPINWQEAPNNTLGWDEADSKDVTIAKLQEKFPQKRMGEIMEELQGLRRGVNDMAEANWDLAQVLYCRFQSVDTLIDEIKIFRVEHYLPKLVPEPKAAEDELQEALREVKELEEECLEWVMERLQMRMEWMEKGESALAKHLKSKGKEQEDEQGTRYEEEGGEAK